MTTKSYINHTGAILVHIVLQFCNLRNTSYT